MKEKCPEAEKCFSECGAPKFVAPCSAELLNPALGREAGHLNFRRGVKYSKQCIAVSNNSVSPLRETHMPHEITVMLPTTGQR